MIRRRAKTQRSTTGSGEPEIPGYGELRFIGEGGAGIVYRAIDLQRFKDRPVALKVFRATVKDHNTLERFESECELIGKLWDAPNVVVPLDRGVTQAGNPWLSMEYFPKGSLAESLAEGPLPLAALVGHVQGIARALAASHGLGIIHRDVKPENAFAREGVTKLADFGISVRAGAQRSEDVLRFASLHHAAPEVLEGATPSSAGDVYSLASTAYHLLAGHPPFPMTAADTWQSAALRVMSEAPPPLRRHDVPDAVWQVLQEGLAKDPGRRPPSALDFANQFAGAAAADHPVGEAPPSNPPGSETASPPSPHDTRPAASVQGAIGFDPDSLSGNATAAVTTPAHQEPSCAGADQPSAFRPADDAPHFDTPRATAPDDIEPQTTTPQGLRRNKPRPSAAKGSGGDVGGADSASHTVARPLSGPETTPSTETGRSPLRRGLMIGGAISAVLVVSLLLLNLLVPDRPPTPTTTTVSLPDPDAAPVVTEKPVAPPSDVVVEQFDSDLYSVEFTDNTAGVYQHWILPSDLPTTDSLDRVDAVAGIVSVPAGEQGGFVTQPCVRVAVVDGDTPLASSEEACAP